MDLRSDRAPIRNAPAAVLVPVKAFHTAKARLADALDAPARAALAMAMAERVVGAAGSLPVAVVCADADVAKWAAGLGAVVVRDPGGGLDAAVEAGVAWLSAAGARRVIVAHGDLPRAEDLQWVHWFAGVTLVPDRHLDGTNVACIPTGRGFRFSYGPGSFARHRAEARRCGLGLRVVHDEQLGWDVDVPADLDLSPCTA